MGSVLPDLTEDQRREVLRDLAKRPVETATAVFEVYDFTLDDGSPSYRVVFKGVYLEGQDLPEPDPKAVARNEVGCFPGVKGLWAPVFNLARPAGEA